jgi:hypothetical protein
VDLELPFFDDFSKITVYPDPMLWEDQDAFINSTYCVNPVSLGVATLDAIDHTGSIHENANGFGFIADHLTSQPINLSYLPSDSVYLSFYFQPQGLGDDPGPKDSLVLQFYSPSDSLWYSVWNQSGDTLQDFTQVLIPIVDTTYLKPGFRFRFRNYATLSIDASSEGMIANCDHWHIDYIKLDKDRSINDTLPNDVTMRELIRSLLKNHEAMPWDHFLATSLSEMGNEISIAYTNHDDSVRNVTRIFEITDLYEQTLDYSLSAGAANIDPLETIVYDTTLIYTYNSVQTDSAMFEVRGYLITDNFDNKVNDTVIYHQVFRDYFAYDDGSAEGGYGYTGGSAENASLAYAFTSFIPDSLYGIQFYFNQSYQDASKRNFILTVWSDNDGIPGDIIYSKEEVQPEYEDQVNEFHTYKLDNPIEISGKFYVGWQQVTQTFLNIGFDVNRISNDKLFIRKSGIWSNSLMEGAIMVRPVMGKSLLTSESIHQELSGFKIYPNPADDYIQVDYPEGFDLNSMIIEIFDIHGRAILHSGYHTTRIDLSGLSPGVYFLRIRNQSSVVVTKKFIRNHSY